MHEGSARIESECTANPSSSTLIENVETMIEGLLLEEVGALLQKAEREDPHPHAYRALGIVFRQLREKQEMSRVQLSKLSGLRVPFISRLERGKASDVTVGQIVRLAMALEQPVTDFVEQVVNKEKELSSR